MPEPTANNLGLPSHCQIALEALLFLATIALAGCFGPPAMHYDIQEYNKQVVSSEKEMLLYNIAALHYDQPPHFMMLSNIAQTRSFSASAAFQWTNLWNNLLVPKVFTSPSIHGANTYQTSVAAGAIENPTISFVPIQGADFAQRFESPVTDKFSSLMEDESFHSSPEYEWLMLLFAQGLQVVHGDPVCPANIYRNAFPEEPTGSSSQTNYDTLANCIHDLVAPDYLNAPNLKRLVQIDANHQIPTVPTSVQPTASEVVAALQANFKWAKIGGKYVLVNPVKMPAWLDYPPTFAPPQTDLELKKAKLAKELTPIWWSVPKTRKPGWHNLAYRLPAKYQWYEWKAKNTYVLLPEGDVLICHNGDCYPSPRDTKSASEEEPRESQQLDVDFSYGDKIVNSLWPTAYDAVYVELRRGQVESTAEKECADKLASAPQGASAAAVEAFFQKNG